jgi:multidrug efflux pump subunit AcrA (membrane-fusion protein)
MQTHANTSKIKRFFKSKWVTGAMVLIALVAGYYIFHSKSAPYQFITVTQGTITETVSVTGNTTPMKSVSIGFQNSGTIGRTNYNLGDYVNAGAVIAELTTGNLYASLQQAQASLSIAEANLAALTVGTRQEQLVIDQNAVTQAQSALSNAIASAYVASDSAVHVTADQFFTNPRTASAAITFVVPDVELANNLVQKRIELEPALSYWGAQVSSPSFGSSDPMAPATQAVQNLAAVSAFLNDAAAALAKTSPSSSVPAATLATYESNVAAARASIATALTALTSAKTALVTASGTLTLARAGSTAESIAAQRAQVEQARAGVANALANLRGSQIISPISAW